MKFVLGKEQKKFIPKMVETMTYEEAKNMLINHQAWARSESPRYADAVEVAIESLEKQIPKKPNRTFDTTWGVEKVANVCPCCDYYLGNYAFLSCGSGDEKVIYCETCGQAIDWSEVEE